MARKTYLDIVNDAVAECKVSLDPLTPATFAAPPRTLLYGKFKDWVNRVYKDLLVDRNEWFFRMERGTVTAHPRLQLIMTGLSTLAVGDILVSDSSGVDFLVVALRTDVEDVETDGLTEYTVDVSYPVGEQSADNLILNETFSRLSPVGSLAIGRIKGRGRYSFESGVTHIDEIDPKSFTIQPSVAYSAYPVSGDLRRAPSLEYSPFEMWSAYYDAFNTSTGTPRIITRTSSGLYDFYPRPDEPFDVSFDYSQSPKLMVAWDDVPELLPEKFEDRIMWGAIAEFADFDERTRLYSRAKKNIDRFTYLMGRDTLPRLKVDLGGFDY